MIAKGIEHVFIGENKKIWYFFEHDLGRSKKILYAAYLELRQQAEMLGHICSFKPTPKFADGGTKQEVDA